MRKFCFVLCCILLLQMLCACSGNQDDIELPANFYYCNVDISYHDLAAVISAEERESVHFNGSTELMLADYLSGPESGDLYSPVPAGTKLLSCSFDNSDAYIVFSKEFAKLSGIDLSVCCSCILLTLNEFADVQTLHVSAQDSQLDDRKEFVLSMSDIVLMDTV